jgi:hypothetical protein
MDGLTAELEIDQSAWKERRALLERELVRPLTTAQLRQVERPKLHQQVPAGAP